MTEFSFSNEVSLELRFRPT